MPSSLTWVLSSALVFSTCPPVSVCGTVTSSSTQPAAFLGSMESITSTLRSSPSRLGLGSAFSSYAPSLLAWTRIQSLDDLSFFVPALLQRRGPGILTWFPSATPFGFTLGADLPCPDDPWTGTLGLPANGFFTRFIATHASILTSRRSTAPHDTASKPLERSPTTLTSLQLRHRTSAPLYLRRRRTRPVSYYAFFKGWLLLSQPPGCLCSPTSLTT